MGVLESAVMHPCKTLQILGPVQQVFSSKKGGGLEGGGVGRVGAFKSPPKECWRFVHAGALRHLHGQLAQNSVSHSMAHVPRFS